MFYSILLVFEQTIFKLGGLDVSRLGLHRESRSRHRQKDRLDIFKKFVSTDREILISISIGLHCQDPQEMIMSASDNVDLQKSFFFPIHLVLNWHLSIVKQNFEFFSQNAFFDRKSHFVEFHQFIVKLFDCNSEKIIIPFSLSLQSTRL